MPSTGIVKDAIQVKPEPQVLTDELQEFLQFSKNETQTSEPALQVVSHTFQNPSTTNYLIKILQKTNTFNNTKN